MFYLSQQAGRLIIKRSDMKRYLKIIPFTLLIFIVISCANTQEPFSFIQICDPQLGMGGYEDDVLSLGQAVKQVNELDVDFVIFCGDLVHHANENTFADFKMITSGLDIPFYCVPGNHDVGMVPDDTTLAFYRSTMGEDYFSFQHKGVSFIFTNSQLWKTDIGEESQEHDLWFNKTLTNENGDERKIVIGHFPIYIKSIDEKETYSNLPPEKREPLLETFSKNNVEAYLSGHKHEVIINNYKGVQLLTGESTSKNFDKRPKGFRKWEITADTMIHTFVALEKYFMEDNK
jgi:3',5'-cyclic AMP phosphodiesterase CpdA